MWAAAVAAGHPTSFPGRYPSAAGCCFASRLDGYLQQKPCAASKSSRPLLPPRRRTRPPPGHRPCRRAKCIERPGLRGDAPDRTTHAARTCVAAGPRRRERRLEAPIAGCVLNYAIRRRACAGGRWSQCFYCTNLGGSQKMVDLARTASLLLVLVQLAQAFRGQPAATRQGGGLLGPGVQRPCVRRAGGGVGARMSLDPLILVLHAAGVLPACAFRGPSVVVSKSALLLAPMSRGLAHSKPGGTVTLSWSQVRVLSTRTSCAPAPRAAWGWRRQM